MIFYQGITFVFSDKKLCIFFVDFYSHKAKLIVEIDGSQHYIKDVMKKDAFRTYILEGYDLLVIRFTNRDIKTKGN